MTRMLIVTTFAGAVLAAGTMASAQAVSQGSGYKGDLAAFHGDDQSLTKALRMIRMASGDRVVDIRFEAIDGEPGYDAVLQHNHRVTFLRIDERKGAVTQLDAASMPQWTLNWEKRDLLKVDRHALVPLAQAIRTAEGADGGAPAVAAGIARSAENPLSEVHAYNVLLDVGGTVKRVAVDSKTGEVIADPQALSY